MSTRFSITLSVIGLAATIGGLATMENWAPESEPAELALVALGAVSAYGGIRSISHSGAISYQPEGGTTFGEMFGWIAVFFLALFGFGFACTAVWLSLDLIGLW